MVFNLGPYNWNYRLSKIYFGAKVLILRVWWGHNWAKEVNDLWSKGFTDKFVQPLISLLYTSLWKRKMQRIIPSQTYHRKCTIAQQWCHNKSALRILWICACLSRTKIILWMRYASSVDARLLYLVRRKKKKKIFQIHPRYKIVNSIQFC